MIVIDTVDKSTDEYKASEDALTGTHRTDNSVINNDAATEEESIEDSIKEVFIISDLVFLQASMAEIVFQISNPFNPDVDMKPQIQKNQIINNKIDDPSTTPSRSVV